MHIMSTNFAKTLVWKHEYDVRLWGHIVTSQTEHTKYKWPAYASEWNPLWKFFAYATACTPGCEPLV